MSDEVIELYDKELDGLPDIDEIVKRLYKGTWSYSYTDADGNAQYRSGRVVDIAADLLRNEAYRKYRFPGGIITDKGFWQWENTADDKYIKILYLDSMIVSGMKFKLTAKEKDEEASGEIVPIELYRATYQALSKIPVGDRVTSGEKKNYDGDLYNFSKALCAVQDAQVRKEASSTNIITNLAMFFKQSAFTTSSTGWVANKASIQNAIMYVLLVCYSLVFFISYTKRLFYVIILVLMAPIVVVFDFFMKFGK